MALALRPVHNLSFFLSGTGVRDALPLACPYLAQLGLSGHGHWDVGLYIDPDVCRGPQILPGQLVISAAFRRRVSTPRAPSQGGGARGAPLASMDLSRVSMLALGADKSGFSVPVCNAWHVRTAPPVMTATDNSIAITTGITLDAIA
jgi:hypothetical protein